MAAKTQPGPTVASSAPASAGATSIATLSFHPDTTLAAVSSSGRRARNGTSAVWAGRVVVIAAAESAARKYTRYRGPPLIRTTATTAISADCTR